MDRNATFRVDISGPVPYRIARYAAGIRPDLEVRYCDLRARHGLTYAHPGELEDSAYDALYFEALDTAYGGLKASPSQAIAQALWAIENAPARVDSAIRRDLVRNHPGAVPHQHLRGGTMKRISDLAAHAVEISQPSMTVQRYMPLHRCAMEYIRSHADQYMPAIASLRHPSGLTYIDVDLMWVIDAAVPDDERTAPAGL